MIERPFHGNVIKFLKAQPHYPKVYWNGSAAFGMQAFYDEIPLIEKRVWGGMDFPIPRQSNLWEDFPSCGFFKPKGEIFQRNSQWILRLNEPMELVNESHLDTPPPFFKLDHLPTHETWDQRIASNLENFEKGLLKKVVSARKSELTFDQKIDPFSALEHLPCLGTRFLFQFSPNSCFLGTTPELLYERKGTSVLSHAVAGTRRRGIDPIEDAKLKQELLGSDKDLREFEFVRSMIYENLSKVCSHMELGGLSILETPTVQHLFQEVRGKMRLPRDYHLLKLLHPTPATCGMPKKKALETIAKEEAFDRGWYASPIGFVERGHAKFMVALRSMLIRENSAHLFAGTGIVPGSEAESEWNELDYKIKTAVNCLINSHAHDNFLGTCTEKHLLKN